jgi:LysM repeat protein
MIKLLVLVSISFFNPTAPKDSIGVEIISGKTFVVHKVSQGETLYGISKRYGVSLDQILEFNPTADGGLEIDQILKIPYIPRAKRPTDETIHKVGDKETLFSISKLYGVTVDEIRQWNNLTDSGLTLGRELIIKKKNTVSTSANTLIEIKPGKGVHTVAPKETIYSITRQYGITRDQLKEWNGLQSDELSIGQNLMVIQPIYSKNQNTTPTETVVAPPIQVEKPTVSITPVEKVPTIRISENVKGSDEVLEAGLAELIESTEANRKYLALHRTAPVGTILKVRNEMNNREVFVRVIGKLPDNAMTDKVIIRVSKSAYDRLGAIDPRFRVEVTYYK